MFYFGSHSPVWGLYNDKDSITLTESFISVDTPDATGCYAPELLWDAEAPNWGWVVTSKNMPSFSNGNKAAVGLTDVVPYLLKDKLVAMGSCYQKLED